MATRKRNAARRGGEPVHIAVINAVSDEAISDARLAKVVAALQKQVTRDFAPVWGVSARLTAVKQGEAPPRGAWWLALHDDSDRAGDLGYHDLTSEGLPLGKAFVSTAHADDVPWTVVLSHELLEMLIDPYINLAAFIKNPRGGLLYGYEICDPCRGDGYRIDGVAVSNFVHPAWFQEHAPRRGTRFDHARRISRPLQLRPGGYSIVNDLAGKKGWKTKSAGNEHSRRHLRPGTRLERRAAAPPQPRRSKPAAKRRKTGSS
jgi:hypothetical protein